MNGLFLGIVLVGIGVSSCSLLEGKRKKSFETATDKETKIVLALLKEYQASNKTYGEYTSRKVEDLPTWSRLIPLDVLHSNSDSHKRPAYDKFSISPKELASYTAGNNQPFALQDSVYLFKQVRKVDELLDSAAFKPECLLTPHEYNQPQIKRKIRNRFYRFSQPLFSPDSSSAYIQVDQAGSRTSYIMSKLGDKWLATKAIEIWVE